MRAYVYGIAALAAAAPIAQPASAALVTLDFTGAIGPMTTPAILNGGPFDGSIQFDDAEPFPAEPARLDVTTGSLSGTYLFGATSGAFVPAAYRVTYNDSVFRFQGTSDDGASLVFDLMAAANGAYSGSFAFAKGSDFSAVGDATISGGAVPEPATWAMLIAAFGIVGAIARRSRSKALGLAT